jgi:hypothetical protein
MPHRLLPLIVLCLACLPLRAEVYRWVDADGRVHFSDRRPEPGARGLQSLEVPDAAASPDPQLQAERERARRLLQVWDEERLAREQATAEETVLREEQCAQLREHIEELDRARRVYREDGSDTPQLLSEAERRSHEQAVRAVFSERCG